MRPQLAQMGVESVRVLVRLAVAEVVEVVEAVGGAAAPAVVALEGITASVCLTPVATVSGIQVVVAVAVDVVHLVAAPIVVRVMDAAAPAVAWILARQERPLFRPQQKVGQQWQTVTPRLRLIGTTPLGPIPID